MTKSYVATLVRDFHMAAEQALAANPNRFSGPAETLAIAPDPDAPIKLRVASLGNVGEWLLSYTGGDVVVRSISQQAAKYKTVSIKQLAIVEREYEAAFEAVQANYASKNAPVAAPRPLDVDRSGDPVPAPMRTDREAGYCKPAVAPVAASIPNGYYTVVLDDGSHVTLRIKAHFDAEQKAKGVQMVGYLAGSDNTSDYVNFAFLNGSKLATWSKYRGQLARQEFAFKVLAGGDVAEAGAAYAVQSGNCYRCARMLTDPDSIAASMGPECRSKGF